MSLEVKKKKKKIPRNIFFLRRTDLTFYLELFKLPQIAKKFKQICKHVDSWLEPVRYQYCPDSLPGSLYLTSCHPSSRSCAFIPQQSILSHCSTFIHCCKPQISKWEVRVEFMMTLHFLIFLLLVYPGRLRMTILHLVCFQFVFSYRHTQINLPKTSLWSFQLIFKNPHDYPLQIN